MPTVPRWGHVLAAPRPEASLPSKPRGGVRIANIAGGSGTLQACDFALPIPNGVLFESSPLGYHEMPGCRGSFIHQPNFTGPKELSQETDILQAGLPVPSTPARGVARSAIEKSTAVTKRRSCAALENRAGVDATTDLSDTDLICDETGGFFV